MDANFLGENTVHDVNLLTVVANESYKTFTEGLQTELREAIALTPVLVSANLFEGKTVRDGHGKEYVISDDDALEIYEGLITSGYVKKGILTDKFYDDKRSGVVNVSEGFEIYKNSIVQVLETVFAVDTMLPEDARKKNVLCRVDDKKLNQKEFQELWKRINSKSAYIVKFDEAELIKNCVNALNSDLQVSKAVFRVESGVQDGADFKQTKSKIAEIAVEPNLTVHYDVVGKIASGTTMTRNAVVKILSCLEKAVFDQVTLNPEEFILKTTKIIEEQKASVIIQHIQYQLLEDKYDTTIFTDPSIRGQIGVNAMQVKKHLYDHVIYDSATEKNFASEIDVSDEVIVYVKLPKGFKISTPVGDYSPDWAIALREGKGIKHIYFVAETKGSVSSLQLRAIEEAKINCAREHFSALGIYLSVENIKYDVVSDYTSLMEKVMK